VVLVAEMNLEIMLKLMIVKKTIKMSKLKYLLISKEILINE
jgi:hypothetical protein